MLFNTIDYLFFLPVVVLLFYSIPSKFRWVLLLSASYLFYMSWRVEYLVLIIGSTLVDFYCGIAMEKRQQKKSRWPFLLLSICTNLGLLFFFKYYNFASENINSVLSVVGQESTLPLIEILLPVGISFYTFQTLSYSIDVYFGRQKADRHLGYFALYVSFFPQLVAGPIERYSRLTPQFREKTIWSYGNLANGLRLILYGLFIKMVIADNLAPYVDALYLTPSEYASSDILVGMICYSFQIYSDFYGYSLIAIGSARLIGVSLMDNFKTPYLAKTIAEFWQRWHISLSTWFRDYVYLPLGGSRVDILRWIVNICAVFLLSGFWHGANWTFVFWGGVFAVVYLLEKGWAKLFSERMSLQNSLAGRIVLAIKTFVVVTCVWVFFRSPDISTAFEIFGYLCDPTRNATKVLSIAPATLVFFFLFLISDVALYNTRFDRAIARYPKAVRWSVYSLLLFGVIAFAGVETFPFIYFQF